MEFLNIFSSAGNKPEYQKKGYGKRLYWASYRVLKNHSVSI
jgi:hypothetical protein